MKYTHWKRYGYHLRVLGEREKGIGWIGATGMTAREVGERALLVFVVHVRSAEKISFSNLTKTSICPSKPLSRSIHSVIIMIIAITNE